MNLTYLLWPLIMSDTTTVNKQYFEYVATLSLTIVSLPSGVTTMTMCIV